MEYKKRIMEPTFWWGKTCNKIITQAEVKFKMIKRVNLGTFTWVCILLITTAPTFTE